MYIKVKCHYLNKIFSLSWWFSWQKTKKILRDNRNKQKNYIETNNFYKKYFSKNKDVVGIHIRGTDQKITPNHHFLTIFDILKIIENKINNNNKIKFLLSLKKKYLEILKKYHNKIFYFNSLEQTILKNLILKKVS